MYINDLQVDFLNIDDILSAVPGPRYVILTRATIPPLLLSLTGRQIYFQLKLSLQETAVKVSAPVSSTRKKRGEFDDEIIQKVSNDIAAGARDEEAQESESLPHGVLFLKLDCESEKMKDKVRLG